jgi:hypothetical protein
MEEIIWIEIKDNTATGIKLRVGLLCCPPVSSKWFSVNYIRELNEGINVLRDKYFNDEFLMLGIFNCTVIDRQVESRQNKFRAFKIRIPPLIREPPLWASRKCNDKSVKNKKSRRQNGKGHNSQY